jgi:dTDP-4-amino-4,6-dideoxygalactose transaminase
MASRALGVTCAICLADQTLALELALDIPEIDSGYEVIFDTPNSP